jgi:HPt (histidine-containing phosphotransfer) domain-containing protein
LSPRLPSPGKSRPAPDPETAAWLEQLRRDYRRGFPEKLALLGRCVDELAEAAPAAPAQAALFMEVHRLVGSAATYGLVEAGAILSEWESRLRQLAPPAGRMPRPALAEMRRMLRKVEQAYRDGA